MILRIFLSTILLSKSIGSYIVFGDGSCNFFGNHATCSSIAGFERTSSSVESLSITECNTELDLSTSDLLSNLTVLANVRNLTFQCPISQIPRGLTDKFPNLNYIFLPDCNISKLEWQAVYSDSLKIIDLKTCPIECSCDHIWMMPGTEFAKMIRPLSLRRCIPGCEHGQLDIANHIITGREGENVTIHVAARDQLLNESYERPYFEWAFSNSDHQYEERISQSSIELVVTNLSEKDIGVIGVRCWHCVDYITAEIQLRVNVSLKLEFINKTHGDTDVLVVHGYPIDNITLRISRQMDNSSEVHDIDTDDVIYFGSLVIRPDKKSIFYRRNFIIFTKDVSDGDHIMGDLLFEVCSHTSCDSIRRNVGHLGILTTTTTVLPDTEAVGTSLPIFFFLLFVLIFALVAAFINQKKISFQTFFREKLIGFRKRISWAQDLQSRRASRETEETLLRLEERSSLSSSDYTNQIIPFIDIGNIKIHEKIGKGAFGEVYCGSWEKLGDRSVAIKTINQADTDVEKEALVLSRLDHPHIVRLYGMTRHNSNLLLVFEMMNMGDLRTYLRARAPQSSNYSQFPPALTENELKKIIADVISGVCYLVAQQIVHRDLAARNCLISGKSDLRTCNPAQRPPVTVKISDFGMSRRLYSDSDYYRMEHHSLLPVRWLPPESLTDHKFSHMSDIWSLGVTMWEIFSYGQVPFSELSNHEVVSYAMAGMRPPKTKLCPDNMYQLMLKCWEVDPEKRIAADELMLDEAFQQVQQKPSVVSTNDAAIIPLEKST